MEIGKYISVKITQQNSKNWIASNTDNQEIFIPKVFTKEGERRRRYITLRR